MTEFYEMPPINGYSLPYGQSWVCAPTIDELVLREFGDGAKAVMEGPGYVIVNTEDGARVAKVEQMSGNYIRVETDDDRGYVVAEFITENLARLADGTRLSY